MGDVTVPAEWLLEAVQAVKDAKVQRDPRHRVSMLVNDWDRIEDAMARLNGEGA